MMSIAGKRQALWAVQDLREQHILAMAERVKIQREIREVVQYQGNRNGTYHGERIFKRAAMPGEYADPELAVEALKRMTVLMYVVRPGRKNRIKPGLLLQRYETAVAVEDRLLEQAAELERQLEEAGVQT